jgi:hypothetical protein
MHLLCHALSRFQDVWIPMGLQRLMSSQMRYRCRVHVLLHHAWCRSFWTKSCFDQDSFTVLRNLEQSLLSGVTRDTIKLYPKIVFDILTVQLPMFRNFRSSYEYKSLAGVAGLMRTSSPEIRRLFSEVCKLIRLLMVSPASSCGDEISFSGLRRLMAYLYGAPWRRNASTMSLSATCIVVDCVLSILAILWKINSFIDSRGHTFGNI